MPTDRSRGSVRIDKPHTGSGSVIAATPKERLQTLLDATLRLSQTIDYAATLENVVRFVAERFASYALLDVVEADGRIVRVSVAHGDPERQPHVERIRKFNPPAHLVATHPVSRAIALGETTVESIDADWIARAAISADHAATMLALEMRTLMVVPVTSGHRIVGALTCVLDARAERATFDRADVSFARELGRRAGLAIENARLYEHERLIARRFQEASLPKRLPASAALQLDAYYRPAATEATVGGDWYDAFALDDARIVLTIGDVVGKGLDAAVQMARLRQGMEAAALLVPRTDAMLEVADRMVAMQGDDLYATGLAAIFDGATRTFAISNAGHLSPLLRHADGSIERVDVAGMMLGVGASRDRAVVLVRCEPGSMLVLFTDGLVEIGRDFEHGERILETELAAPALALARNPARALVDAVVGSQTPTDDIAILIATVL